MYCIYKNFYYLCINNKNNMYMENLVTRNIANEARQKFVSFITTSVNSLYYKHNNTGVPATGCDVLSGKKFMLVTMEMLGLNVGDIVIPASDPNYLDEKILGFYVMETNDDSEIVKGFLMEDEYDMDCDEFSLDQLYAICTQVELNWRKVYEKSI